MQDIPMKRIIRYALAIIIVLTIAAYSNTANAETGSLIIQAGTTSSYNESIVTTTACCYFNMSRVYVDAANYSSIESVEIQFQGVTWANNSNTSAFSIVSNGTGSGVGSYNKNTSRMTLFFASNTVIQKSPLVLLWDKQIYEGIVFPVGGLQNDFVVNSTNPVTFGSITNVAKSAGCLNTYTCRFVVSTLTHIVNNYTVTYTSVAQGNLANVYIDKAGAFANTQITILNDSSTKFQEGDYNTISLNYSFLYDTGLALRMVDSIGDSNYVIVNTTNSTFGATTQPGQGGSPSGQITYTFNNAAIGNNYAIHANITTANYSALTTFYIYAYKPDGSLESGFPISFTSQNYSTGSFYNFATSGTYNASLKYCGTFDITCSNALKLNLHTLDYAVVYIAPVSYAYSITTDKNSYLPGETILYTINNPSPSTIYMDVFNPDINGFGVTELGLNVVIPAGSSGYTISRTIPENLPKDNYTAYLISSLLSESEFNIYASTAFNITTPNSTSNTLFMGWDFPTYTLGDSGKLTTVSDYNPITVYVVSPGGVNKTYIFPANSTNNTMISFNEIGAWKAQLVNDTDYILFRNVSVFGGAPIGNETFSNCLFSANYVCWDNKQYEQGDPYTISFRLEITSLYTYNPYIAIVNPNGKIIANISINGSYDSATSTYVGSTSGSFTPQAVTGVYYARLMPDQLGRIGEKTSSAATVIAKVSATPTEAGTTTSDNLLNSGFFAALLIMIVFVGIGMEIGGAMGAVVGFGGGFIVSAIYDLVPTWAVYLFAILVLTSFAVMVGGKVAGGGNGGGD